LLLAVGRDAVGDVQVVPSGDDDDPIEPLAQVDRSWDEISFADVLSEADVVDPVALAGVQDKASARMISVPVRRRGERFILKVDPPEYRHVVENEAFFLRRASSAGLEAAVAEVVHDRDGRPGLLVRRFDRLAQPDGTSVVLACEDGCQVLGRWPADKYNLSAEEVVVGLAEQCDARSLATRELFRQLVYAWLTGNGDVHAKNLSILATTEGEWRVSPAYDLLTTVPYGDLDMALPMMGRVEGFGRRRLLDFGVEVGLSAKLATRVLDGVLDGLDDLDDELRAGALPFDRKTTDDLANRLRYRRKHAAD
jgi:serine/threonine-protein kinase HipA